MNMRMPLFLLCLLLPLAGWCEGAVRQPSAIVSLLLREVIISPSRGSEDTVPASAFRDKCPNLFSKRDRGLFDDAVELYGKKQYAEAAAMLRKVSARNPKAPDPYFYLGMTAVKRGDNPGAIRRYFNKLMEVCPDYPNALAHYWKGIVDYSDEHYAEATAALQHYFDLANAGNDKECLAVYEEASNYLYWSQFLADAYANPVPFTPVLLRGASSTGNELLPFLTADGKELYYLRQSAVRRHDAVYHSVVEELSTRLCRSTWRDTVFSKGEELSAPFNRHDGEGGVSLSADKRQLYYSIIEEERGYRNSDIYFSTFANGEWQPEQNAGSNVNGRQSWESQPSISADGQWLYFASNREGGRGGTDIWRCRRLANGDWSRAENLGSSVNTAADEKCPFIHADGHTLYFASNGWQGFGGYDEYFIDLSNTNLARPVNMGLPVNSGDDDLCFGVAADGATAYFSGREPVVEAEQQAPHAMAPWPAMGGTDLYQFSLYAAARPEAMRYVALRLQDAAGHAMGGTVTVLRSGCPPLVWIVPGLAADSLQPGQGGVVLSCKENNTVVVTAAGCAPAIFGNIDGKSRLLPATVALQPVVEGRRYVLPIPMDDTLSSSAKQCLEAYASWLLQNPAVHVRIESAAGAAAACHYLLNLGLRAERLAWQANPNVRNLQIVITQR